MEFEETREEVRRVLRQYAENNIVKAATVVAAALNEAYSERGHVFMVKICEAVFSVPAEEDFNDLRSKILGVHCSRK